MIKIAFDAGHSMVTPGKRFLKSLDPKETREWFVNQRITRYIEEELSKYDGIEILRLDDVTGHRDVPLTERTNKATAWGADLLISNHHNAGVGGGTGGGAVVIVYLGSSSTLKSMQKKLYDKLIAHHGLKGNRSNPIPEANLHMLREPKLANGTRMPALLIENGFMDSKTDVPIILTDDFARKSAKAQTEFIVELFGLKLKRVEQPTEGVLFRVQTGSFRIKENAFNWAKQLKAKGYDAIVKEDGGIFRVQVGAFSVRANADKLSAKLKEDGFANFVTTQQGGTIAVAVPEKPVIVISPEEQRKLDIQEAKEYVGNRALELQTKLMKAGYDLTKYGADGDFGGETYDALLKFQKDHGLTADGLAGQIVFTKLDELLAPKLTSPTLKELQMAINASTTFRLSVDGIIGTNSLKALSSNQCYVMFGKRNELVKWVQRKLAYLKLYTGKIDGIAGSETDKAIRAFQASKGLQRDGIVGLNTWKALIK